MPHPDYHRRAVVQALAATLVLPAGRAWSTASANAPAAELAELERNAGGRLGVHLLDTGSGRASGSRSDERFALCSTFKLLLAAAVLREADAGRMALDTVVAYGKDDMVPYAPVTERHLAEGGMSIAALAEAAQTSSDNVAANLLIAQLGGPQAVTAQLRAMGDRQSRLDRIEPALNRVLPGDERDTTTPSAMAATVARIATTDLLRPASWQRLRGWMIATSTGGKRIRAGLPADWIAGDKTGTGIAPGMANKYNDVAVVWPPERAPVIVAAYYEASGYFESMRPQDEAVLAEVGRIAAAWIGGG